MIFKCLTLFVHEKTLFLVLVATSFALASCDNKKQEAANKEGDAVKATGVAKAATMEARADSTRKAADANADAMKKDKK